MQSRKSLFFLVAIWTTNPQLVAGFLFDPPQSIIKPDLLQITEKQQDKRLKIQIHVGEEDGAQLAVSDLVLELHHENADYEHTSLPGADGQHKKLSSGHRRLDVIQEGHFVSIMGTQHVKPEKGCWEICWRKDRPAGTLICGLCMPQDYKRNDAILPEGEIFISFPVWTRESLKEGQVEKERLQLQLEEFIHERDEALAAFDATQNPIMRAIHIHNALAACDKYNSVDHGTLETIPMDSQVFEIQNNLLMTEMGLVWKRSADGGHSLLGTAYVAPEVKNSKSRLMP